MSSSVFFFFCFCCFSLWGTDGCVDMAIRGWAQEDHGSSSQPWRRRHFLCGFCFCWLWNKISKYFTRPCKYVSIPRWTAAGLMSSCTMSSCTIRQGQEYGNITYNRSRRLLHLWRWHCGRNNICRASNSASEKNQTEKLVVPTTEYNEIKWPWSLIYSQWNLILFSWTLH